MLYEFTDTIDIDRSKWVLCKDFVIDVVVEELIPESQSGHHSNIGTIGVAIGFVIMMILDVALG